MSKHRAERDRSASVSRWILPVAVALTVGIASVGAYGQSPAAAAVTTTQTLHHGHHGKRHHHHHHRIQRKASSQKARAGFDAWRVWCKHHTSCVRKYTWVARGNPVVRHAKWRLWCLSRADCQKAHSWLHWNYYLTGPVGAEISRLPEGAWVPTFMQAAAAYGVSPEIMMGIGIVESGGGVAGTAYEGCMNGATFGSWPGQIYCAAQVLSRVGLNGYNSVNPSYASTVMGEADGIGVIAR